MIICVHSLALCECVRVLSPRCEVDFDDPYLKLDFPSATTLPPPCISVNNVAFAYPLADGTVPETPLYDNCNFGLDCESRVAIVGPNGAGKSTFLKLLTGEIEPTEGHVGRRAKLSGRPVRARRTRPGHVPSRGAWRTRIGTPSWWSPSSRSTTSR